jgi:hypothetical protein
MAIPHGTALFRLGYILRGGVVDAFGRKWKYSTGPAAGSGPTNYFSSLGELRKYINDVHEIRRMQEGEKSNG